MTPFESWTIILLAYAAVVVAVFVGIYWSAVLWDWFVARQDRRRRNKHPLVEHSLTGDEWLVLREEYLANRQDGK